MALRWIALALLAAAPSLLPAQEDVAGSDAPTSKLVEQFLSGDQSAAHRAATALSRRPELAYGWSEDAAEYDAARERLMQELTPLVPRLITALDSSDREVVESSMNCLSLLGPRAKQAAPRIWKAAQRAGFEPGDDPDSGLEVNYLMVLRTMLPDEVPVMPYVVRQFRELSDVERAHLTAVRIVGAELTPAEAATDSDDAIPVRLIGSIVDSYSVLLKATGWGAVEVPGLVELTSDEFPRVVRLTATMVLWVMEDEAASGVPALTQLLTSDDVLLRWCAANALLSTQAEEARVAEILKQANLPPAVQAEIRDNFQEFLAIRRETREYLQHADDDVPLIVESYIRQVRLGRGSLRRDALRSLKVMGPKAQAALPVIRTMLDDTDELTRRLVQEAIAAIQLTDKSDSD